MASDAKTIDAVSLRAGVVADGWLPHAARAMAHLMAQAPSREAETTSRELGRLPYSRSSFERVGHAVGERYDARHEAIEAALIELERVPAEARTICVSLDRGSVPMEESRSSVRPSASPRTCRCSGRGLAGRRSSLSESILAQYADAARHVPPKVQRAFRMAYCATISPCDAEGEALHTIRYRRMPKGDLHGLGERMAADVRAWRTCSFEGHERSR